MSPDGPVTIACVRKVPPETKDWYICLRAPGGKAMEFAEGSEKLQVIWRRRGDLPHLPRKSSTSALNFSDASINAR
jgi:hypothetical protein